MTARAETAERTPDLYAVGLAAGGLVTWETDLEKRTRTWTAEAARLFELDLPVGVPLPLGESDHLLEAMHPEDRDLLPRFHALLRTRDEIEAEYRILRGPDSVRWLRGRGIVIARAADGTPRRVVHITADVTEEKRHEAVREYLIGELKHRTKNIIALVQAVSNQTAKGSDSVEAFMASFARRLASLARSIDRMGREDRWGTTLKGVVTEEIYALADRGGGQVTVEGPDIAIGSNTAQHIGLAVHELTCNAIKYGALSRPQGRVAVHWTLGGERAEALDLCWAETGGPRLDRPPETTGFGSLVTKAMLEASLGAEVGVDYRPEGLVWSMYCPQIGA